MDTDSESSPSHHRWIDRLELQGVSGVQANIPLACYLLPTNYRRNPNDPSRQRRDDPNHGRLIDITLDDNDALAGSTGIYLEFCGEARSGNKHRVLLIEPDGTLGECCNVRENRFLIKANNLSFVPFEVLNRSQSKDHPSGSASRISIAGVDLSGLYPGYPGIFEDPHYPDAQISPEPGPYITPHIDKLIARIALHMVQRGYRHIPSLMVQTLYSRLFQWTGYYAFAGNTETIDSSSDSDAAEPDTAIYPLEETTDPSHPMH